MLSFEKIVLKSSKMGEGNIIPDIHNTSADPYFIKEESVTDADELAIGEGMISTILPYKMQNRYSAELYDTEYVAAVLENEHLKAVFLPELGGRLWSLYDKDAKRDIIYANDAVKFGNLAIRNAWFAGGVEWNIGMKGHSPLTCDRIFAQKVVAEDGEEMLKMYAYEEIRSVVYSMIFRLYGNELLVKINIENPNDNDTYMYWWSNIAVEQNEDSRFLTPAEKSFITSYRDGGYRISKMDIPYSDGKDLSYPYSSPEAIDYFYDVPKENKKWISCIDKEGKGLLQFSTPELIGRKCFLWGQLPGGRHWNEWLTVNRDYLEIQAGLRKTQFEHFLMPKHSEISWCEVYKFVDIGSNEGDYFETCSKVDSMVYDPICHDKLFNYKQSENIDFFGTSRGALEECLRGKKLSKDCIFPKDSITDDFRYYVDLLEGKNGTDYKVEYAINPRWAELILERTNKSALDCYLLGINLFANGKIEEATKWIDESINKEPTYYALAAMALLKANKENNLTDAIKFVKEAITLNPDSVSLAHTFGELSINAKSPNAFIEYVEGACDEVKTDGRVRMYLGNCYILAGDLEAAKKHINGNLIIPDIREGEYSISNIWIELYRCEISKTTGRDAAEITDKEVLEKYPLPYSIDFRMH